MAHIKHVIMTLNDHERSWLIEEVSPHEFFRRRKKARILTNAEVGPMLIRFAFCNCLIPLEVADQLAARWIEGVGVKRINLGS